MSHKKILVIEDNDLNMKLVRSILNVGGYQVIEAIDAESGIDLAKEHMPDLILMDIDLGRGIDGTKVAEKILSKYNLPLIFLSSHTEKDIVKKTEGITSYGYIDKNSGETVFLASIKMAFRLFEMKIKESIKESELQKSEERFRLITEGSHDLLTITDLKMRPIWGNKAWEDRFGPLLTGDDIANAIHYIVTQPPHVHICDIIVRPTRQDYP